MTRTCIISYNYITDYFPELLHDKFKSTICNDDLLIPEGQPSSQNGSWNNVWGTKSDTIQLYSNPSHIKQHQFYADWFSLFEKFHSWLDIWQGLRFLSANCPPSPIRSFIGTDRPESAVGDSTQICGTHILLSILLEFNITPSDLFNAQINFLGSLHNIEWWMYVQITHRIGFLPLVYYLNFNHIEQYLLMFILDFIHSMIVLQFHPCIYIHIWCLIIYICLYHSSVYSYSYFMLFMADLVAGCTHLRERERVTSSSPGGHYTLYIHTYLYYTYLHYTIYIHIYIQYTFTCSILLYM